MTFDPVRSGKDQCTESSVSLGFRRHVGNADYFVARCGLNENIKKRFDLQGICIPFPQRDLHLVGCEPLVDGKSNSVANAA